MNFFWTYTKANVAGEVCPSTKVRADWCCAEHRKRWEASVEAAGYTAGLLAGLERIRRGPAVFSAKALDKLIAHVQRTGRLEEEA